MAGLEKDMARYKAGKIGLSEFMRKTGMGSFTDLEVKHILGLKPEEAGRQIVRFMVEKTHFRYKKHERGTGALSGLGEFGTSLLQFPRSVIARFTDASRMVVSGRTHRERMAGAELIVGFAAMGWVANEALKAIAGTKKYYDPDLKREVEYNPYGMINAITGMNFGGAQPAQVRALLKGVKLVAELATQKTQGKLSSRREKTLIREILKLGDGLAENFTPFLRKAMDILEGLLGVKSYKAMTTTFDIMTKRRSATKRNKAERNLINSISHAVFGTERREE